ncbi:hypothetical protein P4H70_23240 [Paenibacillus ehimensis]|uniref:hypothetical protein n=1 Tax=Paenibacillus ehimensis TaxID=79264 RepID=UPI002DBF96FC|nr:hypothetical protein [Paenibacillus ehimensis]MEC0211861.1 hypothetical protein [Paenibacillus ehimensis]
MNEQQIRDMKPGRELDAAVAEFVMKLPEVRWWESIHFKPNKMLVYGRNAVNSGIMVPQYSTDISAAAMEVEAKVLSMDDETKVRYMQALWDVLNITVGEEDHWVNILKMVHASAADRCRAALLAIGGAEQ